MTLTIITPTRDRPEAFALCMKWMFRQSWNGPTQLLLVDDGDIPATIPAGSPSWLDIAYLRRPPSSNPNTLWDNLLHAIPHVLGEKVVFWEDDEYYSPRWLEIMAGALNKAELAGEMQARCYNVRVRGWYTNNSQRHASLCRTGFHASLLPKFAEVVKMTKEIPNPFIDLFLWGVRGGSAISSSQLLLPWSGNSVAIKGLPGRGGIGRGHRIEPFPTYDLDLSTLHEWIGKDADEYARFHDQGSP